MDEDYAIRRGARIDMRASAVVEFPSRRIIPARPDQVTIVNACGRELISQRITVQENHHKSVCTLHCQPIDEMSVKLVETFYRDLETRVQDHLEVGGLLLEKRIVQTPEGPKTELLIEFTGRRYWILEEDITVLEERPDPATYAEDPVGGAKARAVHAALLSLYPDGVINVPAKERDNAVRRWLETNKYALPGSSAALTKAVQRAVDRAFPQANTSAKDQSE